MMFPLLDSLGIFIFDLLFEKQLDSFSDLLDIFECIKPRLVPGRLRRVEQSSRQTEWTTQTRTGSRQLSNNVGLTVFKLINHLHR